jgi:hypothetical protein
VNAKKEAAHLAKRSKLRADFFNSGEYTALLVCARLAGMPQGMIDQYNARPAKERYNKRHLFAYWVDVYDKGGNKPDQFRFDDWLTNRRSFEHRNETKRQEAYNKAFARV